MKSKYYSLKYAVILPFIALIILILSIQAIISKLDYAFLAREHGQKIVQALNETTQSRLSYFLVEPLNVNSILGSDLVMRDLDADTFEDIEHYLYKAATRLQQNTPQITAISYGDENGNFVGYRFSSEGYNLLLKDARSDDLLTIYSGKTIDTPVLAQYDHYDPRTRPWYAPVKDSPIEQISDIYVNYDEIMESSMTFVSPVFNADGSLKGVMATDVTLNGINNFLKENTTDSKGVIYIVNHDNEIIAHSGEENTLTIIPGDPPSAKLTLVSESSNPLISASADLLQDRYLDYDTVLQPKFNGANHYMLVSHLREPTALNWRIVVIIPESDLMGVVRDRNNVMFGIQILIAIIGLTSGLAILTHVTDPIIDSTHAAVKIASGSWDAPMPSTNVHVREVHDLSTAIVTLGKDLKNSFEEIKFKEERYRSLVESVDAMIYSLSPQGILLSVNQPIEEVLNIKREDVIGQHFSKLFGTQETINFWQRLINETLQKKEKLYARNEYYDAVGNRKIATVTMIPVLDDYRNIIMIIGANTDITELIQAQEEIEQLNASEKERLEDLVKQRTEELERVMTELVDKEKLASLGSLVSGIAHEINTPLGVAVSAASLLEKHSQTAVDDLSHNRMSKETLIDYITSVSETGSILSSNLNRASNLVKSFKEIAVNQSIESKLHFNVYDYIQSILLSLKHEYKNKGHTFEIRCPKDLMLFSYSGAFSQILTNFIMNSIIHGFNGKTDGHVIIEVVEGKDTIKLVYSDDGIGMTEEVKKHIFEPFYTTNRGRGGSGLGLNVVYNIVTGQLNGRINCDSEPESGTVFTIEFDKE
ncbi:MAG: PAS domain S-box protein [Clostridia bacterium]|nr:PAS domain S-box protein [Clostridia bacterium]